MIVSLKFLLCIENVSCVNQSSSMSSRISSSGMEAMEDEGLDSDADVDIGDSDAEEDSDADEDLAMEMEDNRPKADEMGVEHLATLERLRQNQRQDYLKVKGK